MPSSECTFRDDAATMARLLALVEAPEAALPMLELQLGSKAQAIAAEWISTHSLAAAVGLTPAARGQGKLAEAARERLHTMRRAGLQATLEAALSHLTPEHGAWLKQEILDFAEETLPELGRAELPEALRAALTSVKAAKLPGWLSPASLPPIKLEGKKLAAAEVATVLAALKATALGASSALVSSLKQEADRHSLDAFAWKLFDLWQGMGAPSKDRWAMAAIGHLGGDACVLKLTSLVREWPGESQHTRAAFGLECLRAIGSDTALTALNGIAQKLKFKGLKQKAQEMMEGIAQARGLTREQLADRVVPDCGLDARGSRAFDFGPRQFRFVLGPEMKPLVRDGAGKIRSDLPAPTKTDDRDKAEAAVAEWKLLKKTLREVLKIQAERLEDTMISGRRWTPDEFQTLLVQHPLMINLVRQLVLAVYDDAGKVTQTFRVTEDQTLADHNDEEIGLPSNGSIGVLHPAHLDEATKSAWGQLRDHPAVRPIGPRHLPARSGGHGSDRDHPLSRPENPGHRDVRHAGAQPVAARRAGRRRRLQAALQALPVHRPDGLHQVYRLGDGLQGGAAGTRGGLFRARPRARSPRPFPRASPRRRRGSGSTSWTRATTSAAAWRRACARRMRRGFRAMCRSAPGRRRCRDNSRRSTPARRIRCARSSRRRRSPT